ncbi:MAG TPA: chorismate synthase [Acidimicrobiia bacterium]|nr:chorismate synthase [Acidimicrobiia bacterium]
MLRFLTAGESHGPGLVATIEGLPAGLEVEVEGLQHELARRRLGFGRGPRMKLEKDELEILGGVRHGTTLGSPVAVIIRNTEWPRWQQAMSPEPQEEPEEDTQTGRKLTAPRPGHADLAGMMKYDRRDARDILERASARETAARTVVGYLAKQLLRTIEVEVLSHVVAIGKVTAPESPLPTPADLEQIDASEVRCFDPDASAAMIGEIEAARADRDTVGGVVEVLAYNVPPGLGSHVHWDRRIDGLLAGALMSIHAIKAVEIGDGLETARRRGTEAHDEIYYEGGFERRTNRAGGTEGGMTVGGLLRVRAAMKPISTVLKGLETVDIVTRQSERAFYERSDTCAVPAAGVVAEQMVAIVLAQECQRVFGGDTVKDFRAAALSRRTRLAAF